MNTRPLYDDGAYPQRMHMSTQPGMYQTTQDNLKLTCFPTGLGPPAHFVKYSKELAHVENQLENRNLQLGKYSTNVNDMETMRKTMVNIDIPETEQESLIETPCDALVSKNSLLTRPKLEYARNLSTGAYNFNYLPQDPQEHYPDFTMFAGENTRQFVIDTYNKNKRKTKEKAIN